MNILTTLGRRALTTLTATAIVAGGVVAPHATAEEVKNADLYWGFSGSSHSKYDHNGPKFEKADKGAELTNIDAASAYAETFKKGVFPNNKREKSDILVFHNGEVKTETNHSSYQISWPGEVTMKLGYGDGLVIKDLNLMLKNGNMGELKATVGENSNIKLFDVQEYSVSDKTITVTPKIPKCTTGTWKPWHNDLTSKLGSLKSVFFESYTCNNDDIAKQPLPLTVVLNGNEPVPPADASSQEASEEKKESPKPESSPGKVDDTRKDEDNNPASRVENKVEKETEKKDTNKEKKKNSEVEEKEKETATETKETGLKGFLNSKAGQILTVALGVLGGLGALWTLWTKFSHLFVR